MKITDRSLSILLAVSLLLNVIAAIYLVRSFISREDAMPIELAQKRRAAASEEIPPPSRALSSSLLHLDSIPPGFRIKRSAILNTLVDKYGCQSYLEIGQGRRDLNLDLIQCRIKIGVDPERTLNAAYQMTSDDFFALNNDSFDLIFIDCLHHADQVGRDMINALDVLNDNGTIVVHDCNPISEEWQLVPPPRNPNAWTGDVWKTWVKWRATHRDLTMFVVDTDFGCGVIRRGRQETVELPKKLTYDLLDRNRIPWLNLVSVSEFLRIIRD